jgi:hypothetical protein
MPSWKKIIVSGSNASLNSLNVVNGITGSFTGSLIGTASFATTASFLLGSIISASNAGTASTVNVIQNPGAGQYAIIFAGSSGAGTGSQQLAVTGSDFSYEPQGRTLNVKNLNGTASFALTASFTSNAISASYASNGGVTQLLAGPNVTLSPTNGLGQVTVSSTSGGGGFNTATGSYGSFYDTTTQTNIASTARSMSFNTTDITNGVSISGSTNPFNTYIKTENAGVYDIQFSAQVDKTDSGTDEIWIWLRKNGTNLTDTATSIQLVGNGAHYVAAWNFFVNSAANDYYQLMWYSPDANVRLHAESGFGVVPGIPSVIATVNRVDQFLSNTGSFTGSFTGSLLGTASYAANADLLDGLNSTVFATTGSNTFRGNQTITGSVILSSSAATELTVVGNSIFSGSLDINSNPSGTYGPFIINSRPNLSNNSVISLINSYQGTNFYATGSSIDFWRFQTYEFPEPSGLFKSAFVQDLNGLNFGAVGEFKWNIFGLNGGVTGSSTLLDGSGNSLGRPIGTNLLTLNETNLSSSIPIVAPSVTAPSLIGTASLATLATTATTATVATSISAVNNTVDAVRYLVFVPTGAGNRNPQINTARLVANSASGSIGIGKSTITTGFHLDVSGSVLISGSLIVTSSVSASTLGQFTGNRNGFVEFSVRNSNNGVSASSDIAVYNNSGSATLNHINMGINSSNIAAGFSFGRGNDSYVYNTGGDLFIGNSTAFYQPTVLSQSLHLFANSAGTPDFTITGSRIGIQKSGSLNATLDISGSVIITGSVQGNVSALTISTNTASIDLSRGNFFTLTLSGSTHFTATNIKPGQTVNILLTTNATNNSASFNSTIFRQPSGSAYTPTGVNGAQDIITLISYDTTALYMASVKNMTGSLPPPM